MFLPRTMLITLAVLAAAPAAQAAPWSAPAPVQGSPDAFANLTFAANGTGLAGWSAGGAEGGASEVFGATVAADGTAGAARRLTGGMLASHLAGHGNNRLVAIGGKYGLRPRPLYALGTIDGALGKPRRLAGARRGHTAGLAANGRGDFAAILRLCPARGTRCSRPTPYLVVRRAGRRLSKPIRLDRRGPVHAATVAINAHGDVLAAWERPLKGARGRRGVYMRMRTAAGLLGRTQRMGKSHPHPKLSAAIGDDPRLAVVGWVSQRMGEGTPHSDAEMWVATRATKATLLETVPNLGTGRYVGHAGIRVAVDPAGRPLVAWTGYQDTRFVVRASKLLDDLQTVSDPAQDTVLSDLDVGPGGRAVVVGLSGIRGADPAGAVGIAAAVRAAGAATFGALETVAEPAGYREAADAEFAPQTDRPVVVWRDLGTRSLAIASREPVS